jgi:hypothetical protein
MAFDAKPQTWLGAGARLDNGIVISVLSTSTTLFKMNGEGMSQFLRNDDPIFFSTSFDSIVANTIYYIRNVTVSTNYITFNVADKASWQGTQTNKTFTNGITKNLCVPDRIWFNIQNTGLTGLPPALNTLPAAQAHRTTGDIRYFFLELPKMLKRLWDAQGNSGQPARVRMDDHDFISDPSVVTRNYLIELDLAYTTTAVAAEPTV